MLIIRLNRTGKRNRAHFRVVLQEHTKAPGKRHVEILGSVDPHKKTTILKKDRILYWIGQGVQTSDTVHNIFVREGVIDGKKIVKKMPRPASSQNEQGEPVKESEAKQEESKSEVVTEKPTEEVKKEEKKEEVAA
ncbi:MAG: 30S ribosomal protein S16 [Candidatus Moranbacteria bacterium]|nr:30S ribosomal protein S16 [Candidatus Moranbacteria bacterium]